MLIFRTKNFQITRASIVIVIIIIITYAIDTTLAAGHWNPYEVLGVQRDATFDQIKKAYREKAIKVHPDKSNLNENESSKKFIELNKAFDILKDPDKRLRFDHGGILDDTRHRHSNYAYQNRQTREYWSAGHRQAFRFHSSLPESYVKKTISSSQYLDFVKLSKTKRNIYFFLFYSEFCQPCNDLEPKWTKTTDGLSEFMDSYTINVRHEPRLSNDLGINAIPQIACLIDGEMHTYTSDLSLASIVKFVRNLLPNNLVNLLISDEKQDRFIALGPQQNKLSAIVIHNESTLKLRYLLLAHEFKNYYRFGHISTLSCQYKTIASRYNLTKADGRLVQTSLLVFDENIEKPTLFLNFDKPGSFDMARVRGNLKKWPYLKLPKLSSQQIFDDLCLYTIPRDGFRTSTKLCVILFSSDTQSSQPMRNKLIEFIEMNGFVHDNKVVFAYIDINKQKGFVDSLLMETTPPFKTNGQKNEISYSIIMIERHQQNSRKALHKWLQYSWSSEHMDRAKIELHDYIIQYKRNRNLINTKVALDILIDEDGPTLMDKIFWRFLHHITRSTHYVISSESFSTVSILILCALITSLLLYQLPSSAGPDELRSSFINDDDSGYHKPANYQQPQQQQQTQRLIPPRDQDVKIIELRAQTYNGLVRLLKPGCRSIILLCDIETREKLLPKFRKAIWPYRLNKTLLFGYLCLDKNLNWFKILLEQVLDVEDLNLNKINCTGTVLVLNGYANKFNIYHAKHDCGNEEDGDFLSFNHDDDELEEQDDIEGRLSSNTTRNLDNYTIDRSLDGLPIWLDKVFDGMTKRYMLSVWPEEIK